MSRGEPGGGGGGVAPLELESGRVWSFLSPTGASRSNLSGFSQAPPETSALQLSENLSKGATRELTLLPAGDQAPRGWKGWLVLLLGLTPPMPWGWSPAAASFHSPLLPKRGPRARRPVGRLTGPTLRPHPRCSLRILGRTTSPRWRPGLVCIVCTFNHFKTSNIISCPLNRTNNAGPV